MLFYYHNVYNYYKVTESDICWKIKHYAKQWLRPFLKFTHKLKIFLKFPYSAVLNKLIRYSYW